MTIAKQTFPAVNFEALENGLFRLEDTTNDDGGIVDLHPAQVRVLASMVGFNLPDRSKEALSRIQARLKTVQHRSIYLEELLHECVKAGMEVFIEEHVGEEVAALLTALVDEFGELCNSGHEPSPDAPENAGGQLALI